MSSPDDTQTALAELDRKLLELQQELARAFEHPEQAAEAPAPPAPPPHAGPPPNAAPPPHAGPPPEGAHAPTRPMAPGLRLDVQGSGPGDAAQRPATVPAPAPPASARLLEQAAAQVDDLGRHLDQLDRLRGALERSVVALLSGVEHAGDVSPAGGSSVQGETYRGQVVINAGPFFDIGTLGSFEHALARLPGVQDVYVRSFEGSRALIDVLLAEPVPLVEELRRVLPSSLGVVDVGQAVITLDVEASSGAGLGRGGGPPAA